MAGFSAAANVLLLVAPVYMLQISDRVLPSASHATLIALTGVAVFLLGCFGLLDWIRQRLMTRVALTLHAGAVDAVLAGSYHASLRRARQSGGQPVRDLATVRQFLNTPSTLAFFDAPWAPVFLGAVFLLHPWLGVLALLSTGVLLGLGVLTETRSRGAVPRGSGAGGGSATVRGEWLAARRRAGGDSHIAAHTRSSLW